MIGSGWLARPAAVGESYRGGQNSKNIRSTSFTKASRTASSRGWCDGGGVHRVAGLAEALPSLHVHIMIRTYV